MLLAAGVLDELKMNYRSVQISSNSSTTATDNNTGM
jgi:hypothetical protein